CTICTAFARTQLVCPEAMADNFLGINMYSVIARSSEVQEIMNPQIGNNCEVQSPTFQGSLTINQEMQRIEVVLSDLSVVLALFLLLLHMEDIVALGDGKINGFASNMDMPR
ncbi:hypothetical protein ACJX0J_023938, partial [Zea mays]